MWLDGRMLALLVGTGPTSRNEKLKGVKMCPSRLEPVVVAHT
jgi:hypothetical protein